MTYILCTTTLLKPLDDQGKEETPIAAFTGEILRYVISLRCVLFLPDELTTVSTFSCSLPKPFRLRLATRDSGLSLLHDEAAALKHE